MNPRTNDAHPEKKLIRQPAVLAMTGLSRSGLYEGIKNGTFPAPVKIGGRAVAFVQHEVLMWINTKIAERDSNSNRTT